MNPVYIGTELRKDFVLKKLYSVHHFQNYKNYYFPGERHDFWEMLYVDAGEILVDTDLIPNPVRVPEGSLIVHRPNEFHRFYADNIRPHDLIVFSFSSDSPCMEFFYKHYFFKMKPEVRETLRKIISEFALCFTQTLNDPDTTCLTRFKEQAGSEQMLELLITGFVVDLLRGANIETGSSVVQDDWNVITQTISYLKAHIYSDVKLDEICTYIGKSESQLQKLFKSQTGKTIMHYHKELRIEEAKYFIRRQELNFNQIADKLGYANSHHFSSQFRKITGETPSQYRKKISEYSL